jgi:sugar lactone lactonase YvrE
MKKALTLVLFSAAVMWSCKKENVVTPVINQPVETAPVLETINFSREALYPEGIAYDGQSKSFLVSSVATGTVGKVDLKGVYTSFITSSNLVSSLGIKTDSTRNRILVAIGDLKNTDQTASRDNLAALGIFNLKTGTQEGYVDLGILKKGSKHLANDIAIDAEGNAYITDSFSPIIYKVDMAGKASIFLENDSFKPLNTNNMAGLNGIAYHPDGYLIVAKMDEGLLFKVPIATPNNFSKIATTYMQGDGLLITKDKKLAVMSPTANRAFLLNTADAWANATVEKTFDTGNVWATTLAQKDNDIFGLYTNDVQATAANNFVIKKVKF